MQIDIERDYTEARWFTKKIDGKKDGDCPQFKVRLFPASLDSFLGRPDGTMVIAGINLFEKFNHCLVEMKNVLDKNGTPVPCTQEIKKKIFDNDLGDIPTFVAQCIRELTEEREKDTKN